MTDLDELKKKIGELQDKNYDLFSKNKVLVDEMFQSSNRMQEIKSLCMNLTESFEFIYNSILTDKQKKQEAVLYFLEDGQIIKELEF